MSHAVADDRRIQIRAAGSIAVRLPPGNPVQGQTIGGSVLPIGDRNLDELLRPHLGGCEAPPLVATTT
jgi:hypothetical protein